MVKLTKVLKGSKKGVRKTSGYTSKYEEKKMKSDLWLEKMGGRFKKQIRGGLKLQDVGASKADAMQDAKKLKEKGKTTHLVKGGAGVWGIYARRRNKKK